MKVIDVFAGAGGLSEGFRQEGFEVVTHIEKERAAALTLKTREAYYYLKENNKLDVYLDYLNGKISRGELYSVIPLEELDKVINTEISNENIDTLFKQIDVEDVDVIIGGPPCQAYSLIGRSRDKEGMKNDSRNYLYKLYIKFLEHYKPKVFVFENVLGILSAKNGTLFEDIKKEMSHAGYKIDYRIMNSSDFGVLQNRKRVIIIGWRKDLSLSYPEFDKVTLKGDINTLFSDLPKIKSNTNMSVGQYLTETNELLESLSIREADWNTLTLNSTRKHNERDLEIYSYAVKTWNSEKRRIKYNELPNRLITMKNTKSFLDRFKVVDGEGISHTVVAHISKDGHHYIHPDIKQNRSLTVREAARIQSFPDNYYFETSRTQAYVQIGNAVPPIMAQEIARKVRNMLNI